MPQSYRDLLQAARALGARGDFRGSARLADDALRQFPDDLELHHLRAAVAERLGDWAGVLQHVARIEAIGAAHEAPAGATTDTTIGAATAATTGPTSDTTADAAHRAVDATPVLRAGGERLATPGERLAAPAALDVMAGWALLQLGRAAEARTRLERATAREPGNATAWVDLGLAHKLLGDLDESERCQRRAAALRPDRPAPILNLAVLAHETGRPDEAIALLRSSRARMGDDLGSAQFEALLSLYSAASTPAQIAALHRACGQLATSRAAAIPAPAFRNPRGPDRVLRIAFVSPDMRDHSVASFLLPLVEALDRDRVQPMLYSTAPMHDAFTERFRAAAPFHEVATLHDAELVDRLRSDRIDVTIDVAGLTQGNRHEAFAARLAPVQATWLGYPATTGLATMDARFVDARTDPPGTEAMCVEKLVRIDPVFVCWRARVDVPLPPREPRASRPLVFGCFNDLSKIGDPVLDAWRRVLAALPTSRLRIKSFALKHERARRETLARLAARGVDASRVELLSYAPSQQEHLALYGGVDIALDTFPYNGTTTTLEALWMGTPVVALEGAGHHARVGASLLGALGREDLVARDVDGYVVRATALALDHEALARDHATLRSQVAASPLRDEAGFARRFESAARSLWKAWCRAR